MLQPVERTSQTRIGTITIGESVSLGPLLGDEVRHRPLGAYQVSYVGDELKRHFWTHQQQTIVSVVDAVEWSLKAGMRRDAIRMSIGFGAMQLGHITAAFLQLHGELQKEPKRLLFIAFAASLKTGELLGIEFEKFNRSLGVNAFSLEENFSLTAGTHILVPADPIL